MSSCSMARIEPIDGLNFSIREWLTWSVLTAKVIEQHEYALLVIMIFRRYETSDSPAERRLLFYAR